MNENKEWIQLPPMKRDTPINVVVMLWEYLKLSKDSRKKVLTVMNEIQEHAGSSDFKLPKLYDIVPKEEIAEFEATMQKMIASIISEASGVACWVYTEKFIHKKSLQEMLDEWEGVGKFIVVMDTLFEKLLETANLKL